MKMRLIKVLLVVFVLSGLSMNAAAQQDSSENNSTPGDGVDADLSPEQQKALEDFQKKEREKQAAEAETPSKPKPSKEVFKPTEEISEDSPVPFPIDI